MVERERLDEELHHEQGRPLALNAIRDANAVFSSAVADFTLHYASPSRTTHTLTGSATPLSFRLPRSSHRTPALVRARPRTMSDTSTSPGADSPLMREAMLTAPP